MNKRRRKTEDEKKEKWMSKIKKLMKTINDGEYYDNTHEGSGRGIVVRVLVVGSIPTLGMCRF